jgi:hypothetical protein
MKSLRAFAIAAILTACKGPDGEASYCGDTFCLRSVRSSDVVKTSPVDDFNLYKVSHRGRSYIIYEGNHPSSPGRLLRHLDRRSSFASVELRRNGDIVEVRFDRGEPKNPIVAAERPFSRYLVVSTECNARDHCSIEEFSGLLRTGKPLR